MVKRKGEYNDISSTHKKEGVNLSSSYSDYGSQLEPRISDSNEISTLMSFNEDTHQTTRKYLPIQPIIRFNPFNEILTEIGLTGRGEPKKGSFIEALKEIFTSVNDNEDGYKSKDKKIESNLESFVLSIVENAIAYKKYLAELIEFEKGQAKINLGKSLKEFTSILEKIAGSYIIKTDEDNENQEIVELTTETSAYLNALNGCAAEFIVVREKNNNIINNRDLRYKQINSKKLEFVKSLFDALLNQNLAKVTSNNEAVDNYNLYKISNLDGISGVDIDAINKLHGDTTVEESFGIKLIINKFINGDELKAELKRAKEELEGFEKQLKERELELNTYQKKGAEEEKKRLDKEIEGKKAKIDFIESLEKLVTVESKKVSEIVDFLKGAEEHFDEKLYVDIKFYVLRKLEFQLRILSIKEATKNIEGFDEYYSLQQEEYRRPYESDDMSNNIPHNKESTIKEEDKFLNPLADLIFNGGNEPEVVKAFCEKYSIQGSYKTLEKVHKGIDREIQLNNSKILCLQKKPEVYQDFINSIYEAIEYYNLSKSKIDIDGRFNTAEGEYNSATEKLDALISKLNRFSNQESEEYKSSEEEEEEGEYYEDKDSKITEEAEEAKEAFELAKAKLDGLLDQKSNFDKSISDFDNALSKLDYNQTGDEKNDQILSFELKNQIVEIIKKNPSFTKQEDRYGNNLLELLSNKISTLFEGFDEKNEDFDAQVKIVQGLNNLLIEGVKDKSHYVIVNTDYMKKIIPQDVQEEIQSLSGKCNKANVEFLNLINKGKELEYTIGELKTGLNELQDSAKELQQQQQQQQELEKDSENQNGEELNQLKSQIQELSKLIEAKQTELTEKQGALEGIETDEKELIQNLYKDIGPNIELISNFSKNLQKVIGILSSTYISEKTVSDMDNDQVKLLADIVKGDFDELVEKKEEEFEELKTSYTEVLKEFKTAAKEHHDALECKNDSEEKLKELNEKIKSLKQKEEEEKNKNIIDEEENNNISELDKILDEEVNIIKNVLLLINAHQSSDQDVKKIKFKLSGGIKKSLKVIEDARSTDKAKPKANETYDSELDQNKATGSGTKEQIEKDLDENAQFDTKKEDSDNVSVVELAIYESDDINEVIKKELKGLGKLLGKIVVDSISEQIKSKDNPDIKVFKSENDDFEAKLDLVQEIIDLKSKYLFNYSYNLSESSRSNEDENDVDLVAKNKEITEEIKRLEGDIEVLESKKSNAETNKEKNELSKKIWNILNDMQKLFNELETVQVDDSALSGGDKINQITKKLVKGQKQEIAKIEEEIKEKRQIIEFINSSSSKKEEDKDDAEGALTKDQKTMKTILGLYGKENKTKLVEIFEKNIEADGKKIEECEAEIVKIKENGNAVEVKSGDKVLSQDTEIKTEDLDIEIVKGVISEFNSSNYFSDVKNIIDFLGKNKQIEKLGLDKLQEIVDAAVDNPGSLKLKIELEEASLTEEMYKLQNLIKNNSDNQVLKPSWEKALSECKEKMNIIKYIKDIEDIEDIEDIKDIKDIDESKYIKAVIGYYIKNAFDRLKIVQAVLDNKENEEFKGTDKKKLGRTIEFNFDLETKEGEENKEKFYLSQIRRKILEDKVTVVFTEAKEGDDEKQKVELEMTEQAINNIKSLDKVEVDYNYVDSDKMVDALNVINKIAETYNEEKFKQIINFINSEDAIIEKIDVDTIEAAFDTYKKEVKKGEEGPEGEEQPAEEGDDNGGSADNQQDPASEQPDVKVNQSEEQPTEREGGENLEQTGTTETQVQPQPNQESMTQVADMLTPGEGTISESNSELLGDDFNMDGAE